MALLPLGPAAPAAPPPPVGFAAVKADAGITVGGMRDAISMVRDLVQLVKEAEPMLKMLRPPEPPRIEYDPPMLPPPRAPAPEAAAARESAPPQSEVEEARREEVAKARADLEKLVNERLSKTHILQLAAAFGPLAIAEKLPKLGDALARDEVAAATGAWLETFTEAELRAVACELLPLVPAKDVPTARGMLASAVKALEKDAEAPAPTPEAPAADEAKEDESS